MILPAQESPFPQQVGPPTQYARDKRQILFVILVVQAILIITRCVFSLDIIGAIFTGIQVFVGYLAWQQDMNITYLSIYGIICVLNGIFAAVMAIVPIAVSALTLSVGGIISACFLPLADAAGAYLAYLVYKDWDQAQKAAAEAPGPFGSVAAPGGMLALGGMGGMAGMFSTAEATPINSSSMFSGKGYTLGDTDAFLTKAKGYGDEGMTQAQSGFSSAQSSAGGYLNQAQGSAGGFFNQAQGSATQAQGSAGGFFNSAQESLFGTKPLGSGRAIPAGHHDVMSDPFMRG